MCVRACACACVHNFYGWDEDRKNIYTLPLKAIQTFSGVNKCTSCRQNVRPVDSHLNTPTHNIPTIPSVYKLKVTCYSEQCKD